MKRQTLHTGIAAAAIWASAAYCQISLPAGDLQPGAPHHIADVVEAHVALKEPALVDSFSERVGAFDAAMRARFDSIAVVTVEVALGRLDALREDPAVASITISGRAAEESRILTEVEAAAASGRRAVAPCEGNGAGALRPLLNAIAVLRDLNIVCSGGEAGAGDNIIHTRPGGEGAVVSALEALGGGALLARHMVRNTAFESDGEAWVAISRAAAERDAGNTVAGVIDPAHTFFAYDLTGPGPVQLAFTRQSPYPSQTQARLSIVSAAGARVIATTGLSANTVLQLSAVVNGPARVVVDAEVSPGSMPVQFVLSSSIPIQPVIVDLDWISRILELLKNQNPKPNENCKCAKLDVKRTALAASAKSSGKGKQTSVSVTLAMGGLIQCEKTDQKRTCTATVTVTPTVLRFATAPTPVPVAITVDCKGPCDNKARPFHQRAVFSFTIDDGLPTSGLVALAVAPKCGGGAVSGPPKSILAFVDSNKSTDLDPDQSDSDGDGITDNTEKKAGSDPNSWESK